MTEVEISQPDASASRSNASSRRPRGHYRGHRRPAPSATTTSVSRLTTEPAPSPSNGVLPEGLPASARQGRGRTRRGGLSASQRSAHASQRAFGGHLTSAQPPVPSESSGLKTNGLNAAALAFVPGQVVPVRGAASAAPSAVKSSAADLSTRITEDIDNGVYECVICVGEVVRTSRIWTCSVCWTVTHLHCAKKWHSNQAKNLQEGQIHAPGWRCPGCNSSLQEDPRTSTCWCGKEVNLRPIMGLPAHSCGQTCAKTRPTCPHPCTLLCHAGPCPPCHLMGETQTCFCGKHSSTRRCNETVYGEGYSCEEVCGDLLSCGEHECARRCHSALCGSCEAPVSAVCYCGKDTRTLVCDQVSDILASFDYGQVCRIDTGEERSSEHEWFEGSFRCEQVCGRKYDCGNHTCQKPCHPQDEAAGHCPLSPDVVFTCPCGKTALDELMPGLRTSCEEEIPRCDKPCGKALGCGHVCPDKCHTNPCRPCQETVDVPCRCGRTSELTPCCDRDTVHPVCARVCHTQLNCGRHECGQVCCPGEKKAAQRQAARRKHRLANPAEAQMEEEHRCLDICGRGLKCGKHHCDQLCHKGPCPSCLEAVFDEISCACGRTVLQPPQPCGTRPPECRFDCVRPTTCGHPAVKHNCHPIDVPCPKCPFLVEKPCVCGKKTLKNQPCWFDEPRCGIPCGQKLKCGAHECEKTCHRAGECEDVGIVGNHCSQPCRKQRRHCEHFCTDSCHAPFDCQEEKPCQSKTLVTCECQNRKQEFKCLATQDNPWPKREPLKCDDECLRLQRNRRLAEALNIDPETHTDNHVPYSDTTMKMYRENVTWSQTQEREFRVFALAADEKRLAFKPMQPNQRAFLHSLAEDFGLDSESQDPEGIRHVTLFKTPRFVSAPTKTLAQCMKIQTAAAAAARPAPVRLEVDQQYTFNAFLLTSPRFGLTIDELDAALAKVLANPTAASLTFATSFLPTEQILVTATPQTTAAAALTSARPLTPQGIELALKELKPVVTEAVVARLDLVGSVALCRADAQHTILRREGDPNDPNDPNGGGAWSMVAKRSAARPTKVDGMGGGMEQQPLARGLLALRKEGKVTLRMKGKVERKETQQVEEGRKGEQEKVGEKAQPAVGGPDAEGSLQNQSGEIATEDHSQLAAAVV